MAVRFFTNNAKQLLTSFNYKIEQTEQKGKITTWKRSDDKKYYTHVSENWRGKAWFKASVYDDKLVFNIINSQNSSVTDIVYSYYHGHLIETFLNHFDENFSSGLATALPTAQDKLK